MNHHYLTLALTLGALTACGSGEDAIEGDQQEANSVPTAGNVRIDHDGGSDQPIAGDELTGLYVFNDTDGDLEGQSTFKWLRDGAAIDGANSQVYALVPADQGYDFSFEVTPIAQTGNTIGLAQTSASLSVLDGVVINQAPLATALNLTFNGDASQPGIGNTLTANYNFSDAEGDLEGSSQFVWLRNGQTIAGAQSATYTLTEQDNSAAISVELTPVAATGTAQGESIASSALTVITAVSQYIGFARSGITKITIGNLMYNPARVDDGVGDITYSSDDETIAIVDAFSGKVTAVAKGSTTITAHITADVNYLSASSLYHVEVQGDDFAFHAWLGQNNSLITFESDVSGIEMFRTTDASCWLYVIDGCTDGTSETLTQDQPQITDTAANLNNLAYYGFKFGESRSRMHISPERFTSKIGGQFINFKGKLWMFGGRTGNGGNNEIWSSVDGHSWTQETTDPSQLFSPRTFHQVYEMNGKLWMTGGEHYVSNNYLRYSDVWTSTDGIAWTLITDAAEFGARANHSMTAANGKLWILGNYIGSGNQKQLWSSTDGLEWLDAGTLSMASSTINGAEIETLKGINRGDSDTLVVNYSGSIYTNTLSDGWSGPHYEGSVYNSAKMLVHNNAIWIISANASSAIYSSNAQDWQLISNLNLPKSYRFELASFNGEIMLIGGDRDDNDSGTQTYSSIDGQQWALDMGVAEYSGRLYPALTSFNGKLMLAGGRRFGHYTKDVWTSEKGFVWQKQQAISETFDNDYASDGSLIQFGGSVWYASLDKVYKSTDGTDWQEMSAQEGANYPLSTYGRFQMVSMSDKLWLIQSKDGFGDDPLVNKTYQSDDGITWNEVVNSGASFVNKTNFSVVSFNDTLWVIGGSTDGSNNSNDIWSSQDGTTWQKTTPEFGGRSDHAVAVWNDKLWVVGGSQYPNYLNDVWSSTDGITWVEETANAQFSERSGHGLAVHNNQLILTGGDQYNSDVWSTDDGINWRKAFTGRVQFPVLEDDSDF